MEVSPCVGCGFCCMKAPCTAAKRLYPAATQCPQLLWSDEKNRYVCGLMTLQGELGLAYRKELYANEGCCMSLNSWRKDVKQRTYGELSKDFMRLDSTFQIFLKCLAGQFMNPDVLTLAICSMKSELVKHGYTEDNANEITSLVVHHLKQNRTNLYDDFLGKFEG